MASPLAKFRAHKLSLRAGRRLIWKDAHWAIQGHTIVGGSNGSGKSTTLKMLAGQWAPYEGTLTFDVDGQAVAPEQWMTAIGLAAPWSAIPSQLSLDEALRFHETFQTPRIKGPSWTALLAEANLDVAQDAPIRHWSSGQRQRLSLALAMGSQVPVVLLDEPTANLDAEGIAWYRHGLAAIVDHSTVVVASNDQEKDALKAAQLLEI